MSPTLAVILLGVNLNPPDPTETVCILGPRDPVAEGLAPLELNVAFEVVAADAVACEALGFCAEITARRCARVNNVDTAILGTRFCNIVKISSS